MSKKMFLASIISAAIFATAYAFATESNAVAPDQSLKPSANYAKTNTTSAQRKEIIIDYKNQIRGLQKDMDTLRLNKDVKNSERNKELKELESQIKALRLKIRNLD